MKRILPYFIFLANLILVLVVARALGFEVSTSKRDLAIYVLIAVLLYGTENWIIDKIRGDD